MTSPSQTFTSDLSFGTGDSAPDCTLFSTPRFRRSVRTLSEGFFSQKLINFFHRTLSSSMLQIHLTGPAGSVDGRPSKLDTSSKAQKSEANSSMSLISICKDAKDIVSEAISTEWRINNGATRHITNCKSSFIKHR
uniref:Uncharacterized protein n=1 Tax=Megaselia scalaris TaxID=36166 RepID=T1H239_MEGSC